MTAPRPTRRGWLLGTSALLAAAGLPLVPASERDSVAPTLEPGSEVPTRQDVIDANAGLAATLDAPPEAARSSGIAQPRPAATGRGVDAVQTLDFPTRDTTRARSVPARLHLPASASARRPVPLVVFSHGLGSSAQGYRWLGHLLAENGIASLHPQHAGSDSSLWSGSLADLAVQLFGSAARREAVARVQDLRFALDALLAGPVGRRIDATRIAAAGHSFGANTTLLASGLVPPGGDLQAGPIDQRLRAAIAISAPPFDAPASVAPKVRRRTVPSLHITCDDDRIWVPGHFSDAEDRWSLYRAVPGGNKWFAMFKGGSHNLFTDRTGEGGAEANRRIKAATADLVLAFLGRVFDAKRPSTALTTWPSRWADLVQRFDAA